MKAWTAAERPDLVELGLELTAGSFPEYNNHGDLLGPYWNRLVPERPDFQFHVLDDDGVLVARCRTISLRWDGTLADLPSGIDEAIARGFDEGGANTLCALVAQIPAALQGRGLSARALEAMADLARAHGFGSLIAPVRPSWKERYPLVPIERYAEWRRDDGLLFDPWLRVHERLGATVLRAAPHSLRIKAPVEDWAEWTGISFPEDGTYWFPRCLAQLEVSDGVGLYYEPNVWMLHTVS